MNISKKTWIVVGGAATAIALAPLGVAAAPGWDTAPKPAGGIVVAAAATMGPTDGTPSETLDVPRAGPTVSAASPQTPGSVDSPRTPASPATAQTPPSPVTPASPGTSASPASPATPATR